MTPVTPLIMSKLSVAKVNILCAANTAAPAETTGSADDPASPLLCAPPMEFLATLGEDGEAARLDVFESAPVPRSRYGARLLDLLTAPDPDAAAVTDSLSLSPSATVFTEGTVTPVLLDHLCGSFSMKPRTRVRAGSGSAPPAYLLTTSTTCRMV